MMFRKKRKPESPTAESELPTPVEEEVEVENEFDDGVTGVVEEALSMYWLIEIFDPPMDYPRDPLTEPPLLYGPHRDPLTALEILDKMLTALNEEVDLFTGRIRPLFVPEVQST